MSKLLSALNRVTANHWLTVCVLAVCGTVLVIAGHVTPSQLVAWLSGFIGIVVP